ncbi:MAG: SH3 domain-containing protein [Clostridioides sp.]|jgi:cell wall-associated NlpC family hydrolase|nr:SH3 domain-containing protein [Clostridioides sp.]
MKQVLTVLGVGALSIAANTLDANAYQQATVTASVLNVRQNASINSSIIGKVYKGNEVEILDKSNGWYKIKVSKSLTGWASGQYISLNASTSSIDSSKTSAKLSIGSNAKVNVEALNVRQGPGRNNSVIAGVYKGDVVQITDYANGWYKIKKSNGTTGWVSGSYIVSTSESVSSGAQSQSTSDSSKNNTSSSSSNVTTSSKSGYGKVSSSVGLNMRSGAGTSYSKVAILSNGEVVKFVEESSNGWYKVSRSNGTSGWVSSQYISSTSEDFNSSKNNNSNSGSSTSTSNDSSKSEQSDSKTDSSSSSKGQALIECAYSLIGTPYKWGASGPEAFDCSGFTQYVYKHALGISIPRVSKEQAAVGRAVAIGDYKIGDLVYFDTSGSGTTSHVGIYIGNSNFIHCSGTQANPNKVKVDSLLSSYYSKALLGARRII